MNSRQMTDELPAADMQASMRIIIGDRFRRQCPQDVYIGICEAEQIVRQGGNFTAQTLYIGQGINDLRLRSLHRQLLARPDLKVFPQNLSRKASKQLTHKHQEHNIAIGIPTSCGDGSYDAQLLVDEECADISDHLTGQHIPGAMLLESIRQMSIATTENFYLRNLDSSAVLFATQQISVEFHDFIFPAPATVKCIPLRVRKAGAQNFRIIYELRIIQAGKNCVTAQITLSVLDKHYFAHIERTVLKPVK